MEIQFDRLKKVNNFLTFFFPHLEVERELNRKNAEIFVYYFSFILDALIKSENLYKKRHVELPEGKDFFSPQFTTLMENAILYFGKFDTSVFKLSRTERQTFIFIIENIVDYFKNVESQGANEEKRSLYVDYKFWLENFFSIFDQKINGEFLIEDNGDRLADVVFKNSNHRMKLSPFILYRDRRFYFLMDVNDSSLIYRDVLSGRELFVKERRHDIETFNFLASNFDFNNALKVKPRVDGDGLPLVQQVDRMDNAYHYYKLNRFEDSFKVLADMPYERLNQPLLFLLQARNLLALKRIPDLKRILQKFILLFPYYFESYEIMGDLYAREENFELALSFYEKYLNYHQSRRMNDKVKKIKQITTGKNPKVKEKDGDTYYDLMAGVSPGEFKCVGREKELNQLMEILISHSRMNVMLVGESGVGKTALIKSLGLEIQAGDVPGRLEKKGLEEINFVSLLTGSKYRGQFEEKVLKLLTDFKSRNSILVLEDIHLMMVAAASRGTAMDLVNILKRFLRERSIQVIATTNYEDYKNTIEKDSSLMGFFQKVRLNELRPPEVRLILRDLAQKTLARDNLITPDSILDDIVYAAKRDIREKRLPDSAIMVFERCAAKVKLKQYAGDVNHGEVLPEDVAEVISDMLNLPESNLPLSLKGRLANMNDVLLGHIIGQDDALERIAANVTASKLNFDVKRGRPDGVFLFVGPTGVGKTETAVALAKALYGSEDYLVRIDMSEYMEKFTYSRFIGAAPGYVGYHDTNQLTDKIRQNPFCVILLDEVEKADAQLLNIFLQVFDAGRLTDARGNVVDFSHTTIIMTSNIGTSLFSRSQMGYGGGEDGVDVSRSSLLKTLKRFFSPEFLNRIDEIVWFRNLDREHIKRIIELQLREVRENLEKQGKELAIADEVLEYIIEDGYSREYGARNISRTLKRILLEKISKKSLEDGWDDAQTIDCYMKNDRVEVELEMAPAITGGQGIEMNYQIKL